MKLWLIEQDQYTGYDVFDSCVVAACNEEDARDMHPRGSVIHDWTSHRHTDWAKDRDSVRVKYLGRASEEIRCQSVICASYNAG
ncbi:hypothetical protein B7759_01383 [Burkholderia glumae]|uniref:hypothetical protein n=1 Tax=Burkholderia glumae TaxID=337 RepID=UPI001AE6EB7D|nr:hypothetical protein [Burkholderia glumae]QTP32805.1 hypothetical protein B7759_01383 [Burkholderia glumae]